MLQYVVPHLKDGSEPYRRMTIETLSQIAENLGLADVDQRTEETLIDGVIYAFQEQTTDETSVILNGFGTVLNTLGTRCKVYLPQIAGMFDTERFTTNSMSLMSPISLIYLNDLFDYSCLVSLFLSGTIRWRLNTPSSRNRQQAADLIARIAVVMKICDEEQMLAHLGLYLYEYLGEEYPEVRDIQHSDK